jgi:hypothetical protein
LVFADVFFVGALALLNTGFPALLDPEGAELPYASSASARSSSLRRAVVAGVHVEVDDTALFTASTRAERELMESYNGVTPNHTSPKMLKGIQKTCMK